MRCVTGLYPKTSQVSPDSILTPFNEYCELGYDFIYVAFSAKLSGTHNLAKLIAEAVKEKYPDRQIAVLDFKRWINRYRAHCFTG